MRRAAAQTALAALAGFALLTGCRIAPPTTAVTGPGADAPWSEQRAALENFARYKLTGRVAVAANGQGFSAGMRYAQQPQRSDLALDGPLGIGGLRVELEGQSLKIFTSRGEQLDGVAARAELERRLGFALPLSELRWWLLGIPAPGDAELNQDAASGEIHGFAQNGWRVTINSRAPDLGFALPRRLTAEREGARLKLLVETWRP
ncbi:MAG: lipoprotein insertase outer membrane protein LolB [Pseudomonadota bacterium]